ncbi:MAG: serine/threonine protein kinase, partial [Nannocystaceae bacterium]|nr:serine/threonine protein kinase [Nannocystaceae bacterium]
MFGDAAPVVQERYLLRERIGAGGLGVVYRAHDIRLDRDVALKFVRRRHGDETEAEAVAREAKVLARLSHPNIVPVFDLELVGRELVMAMELVEGHTLEQRLIAPMPWREALPIFRQIGEALAAAHGQGIVHGDIKPGNIMIDEVGRVRVLDFGLARQMGVDSLPGDELLSTARSSRPSGTAGFLAPERYEGVLDERTDQFAFCVMFYVALMGRVPLPLTWSRPSSAQLAMLDFRGARGNEVPRWLQRVLRRGLSERPQERYPSMAALVEALRAPQRGPILMSAGTTLAIGVAAWSLLSREPACEPHADAFAGTWDAERRSALLERAPQEHGQSIAAAADDVVARWSAADRDSCSARIDEQLPTLGYEVQQACLQRAVAAFDFAMAQAEQPGFTAWRDLAPALTAIDASDACGDADRLLEQVAGVDDPAIADAIYRGIDRTYLAYLLGDDDDYVAQARATLAEHGDRARAPRATLLAEARLGSALVRRRQFDEASSLLESALVASRAWPRWPDVEADLLTSLAAVAVQRGEPARARLHAREAIAALEAAPQQHDRVAAWERLAAAEAALGNLGAALAAAQRAADSNQSVRRDLAGLEDSVRSYSRAALLGGLLARAGRLDEAETVLRAGLAKADDEGASAAMRGRLQQNLGHVLWRRGL